ncbi:hypothetical protein [Psychrobacter sp. JCM 18900]|uniref:hypothetical protein n=1 Tax=Psychrobacter sp. JCM 18900 TaxID=1298608 RepID=UPI0021C2563A|nr:hypothetical protein [Psychrobacter sp. JCM 18900]
MTTLILCLKFLCDFANMEMIVRIFFAAIQNISKESFSVVIWQPLSDGLSRMLYIRELLKHPAFRTGSSKFKEVKKWTLELLQERIEEKPNSKAAIEHLLELTNNLENI